MNPTGIPSVKCPFRSCIECRYSISHKLNTTSPRLSIHAHQLHECISHGPMISRRHANGIRPCSSKVGPDQKIMASSYVRNIMWKRGEAVKQWSLSHEDVQNKFLFHGPRCISSLNELLTVQSLSEGRKWCDASPRWVADEKDMSCWWIWETTTKYHWFHLLNRLGIGSCPFSFRCDKAPDFILAPSSTRFWSPRTSHSKQGQSVVGFRLRSMTKKHQMLHTIKIQYICVHISYVLEYAGFSSNI